MVNIYCFGGGHPDQSWFLGKELCHPLIQTSRQTLNLRQVPSHSRNSCFLKRISIACFGNSMQVLSICTPHVFVVFLLVPINETFYFLPLIHALNEYSTYWNYDHLHKSQQDTISSSTRTLLRLATQYGAMCSQLLKKKWFQAYVSVVMKHRVGKL